MVSWEYTNINWVFAVLKDYTAAMYCVQKIIILCGNYSYNWYSKQAPYCEFGYQKDDFDRDIETEWNYFTKEYYQLHRVL